MKEKTLANRLNELKTMQILTSVEEQMIVENVFTTRNRYDAIIKEMKGLVGLINKMLVVEVDGKLQLNKDLHYMLSMKLETPAQNIQYNDFILTLRQLVNGKVK